MTTILSNYSRKLLNYIPPDHDPNSQSSRASTSSYAGTTCCYNSLKLTPPFDSAMALTILVLLIALFFMAFFSIYIRRFADESRVDPTRRTGGAKGGGVDPTTVGSLPVQEYKGGGMECAICLSEFEEGEWVKEIPYCRHVFHVECIDMWLLTHVTCPLCRTAKLLPGYEVAVHVADEVEEGESTDDGGDGRIMVVVEDQRDTWNEPVGPVGVRRNSGALSTSQGTLYRSFSF